MLARIRHVARVQQRCTPIANAVAGFVLVAVYADEAIKIMLALLEALMLVTKLNSPQSWPVLGSFCKSPQKGITPAAKPGTITTTYEPDEPCNDIGGAMIVTSTGPPLSIDMEP